MKRFLTLLIVFCFVLFCCFSEEPVDENNNVQEEVIREIAKEELRKQVAEENGLNEEDVHLYTQEEIEIMMFELSFEHLILDEGYGGIFCYDNDGNILGEWKGESTPDSFFSNIPSTALVSYVVTNNYIASLYFSILKENETVLNLLKEDKAVVLVSVWKVWDYEDVNEYTFEEKLAYNKLMDSCQKYAISYEEVEAIYSRQGEMRENELIIQALEYPDKTDDIVKKAVELRGKELEEFRERERIEKRNSAIKKVLFISLISLVAVGIIVLIFFLKTKKKKQ